MPTTSYGDKTIYFPEGYGQDLQAAIDRDIHRAVGLGEMLEHSTQDYLDAISTSTMFWPGVGDVAGLAADAHMYATDPDSRNWFNYLFTAAGILPFVPAAAQVRQARKTARKLHEVDDLFHGSNKNFDQFSDDAIGGGQGAQMMGHGHYVSSSEDRSDLFRQHGLERDDDYEDFLQAQRKAAEATENYNRVDLIERLQLGSTPKELDDIAADLDYDDDMREMAGELANTVREMDPNIGKMYQIKTPNITEDEVIDWDKRLEDQSPLVREFFANQPMAPNQMTQENPMYGFMVDVKNKAKMETDRLNAKMSNKVLQQRGIREQLLQKRFDTIEGVTTPNYPGDQPLLDQIDILDNEIDDIVKRRDQTIFGSNDEVMQTRGYSPVKKEASRQLLEGGIKGVKYLDTNANPLPGSNKKGVTNYVIFDANLIEIAKKYGVTIPGASMLLYGATNQGYQEDTSAI